MTRELIPAWTPAQRADFGVRPMTFAHRLVETGAFSDEALAAALDAYPRDLYDINLFDFDADGQHVMRAGTRGEMPGEAVLKALKTGKLWMQMRRATEQVPAFGALIAQAYREIGEEVENFRPMNVSGQLLLSAPGAAVPMHADAPFVILFHLRGRKRIYVYPNAPDYMPRDRMELIVMKQQTEDLPYRRDMDGAAAVFDLEPGMAISWPLHAPHRVENLDSDNLSLTTEYQTWGSRLTNGAYFANGVMRRLGLPTAALDSTPMPGRAALWALSVAMKKMGVVEEKLSKTPREFDLDQALGGDGRAA